MMKTRKGQFGLQNLQGAGLAFVAIIIVLALGATVLSSFQDTLVMSNTATKTNETQSYAATITLNELKPVSSSLTVYVNQTKTIDSTWYNLSGNVLTMANVTAFGGSNNVNVTYTYNPLDASFNVTGQGLAGVEKFSNFNPVIAIAISAVIILGIITSAFAMRR